MRSLGRATVLTCIVFLASTAAGVAGKSLTAGDPDRTFGGDGVASVRFDAEGHWAPMGVAGTPSGGVIQGALAPGRSGFVAKYRRDGSLARSFGKDGKSRLKFESGGLNPRDVLVDRRGRIVVAGEGFRTGGGGRGGAVGRLLPGGRADRSFAGDGLSIPGLGMRITPLELAFAPQGKIVMVGLVGGTPSTGVFVARYLSNGRLDRTFSGDGHRIIKVGAAQSERSVAVDPRGRIVLGAGTTQNRFWILTVIRLLPGGRLDQSFSGDGRARSGPGGSQMRDITIDRRGRVLAVAADYYGTVVRFRRNGRLDRSFANEGRKELAFLSPKSISVDERNRIMVAGGSEYSGAAIHRLRPNGADDKVFYSPGSKLGYFEDHFLDSRGRIVAAGNMRGKRLGVARILNR